MKNTSSNVRTDWKMTISFGKSTSPNYSIALEKAKQYPTYQQNSKGEHIITFTSEQLEYFFELIDLVGGWKSTYLEIDGEKVPYSKIRGALNCYKGRLESYKPDKYCYGEGGEFYHSNIFGCVQCGYDTSYSGEWFKEGKLDSKGIFHVDKKKIEHMIRTILVKFEVCPALNIDDVLEKVRNLPDTINPKKDPEWEYNEEWRDGKYYIVGVKPKSTEGIEANAVIESEAETMETVEEVQAFEEDAALREILSVKQNIAEATEIEKFLSTRGLLIVRDYHTIGSLKTQSGEPIKLKAIKLYTPDDEKAARFGVQFERKTHEEYGRNYIAWLDFDEVLSMAEALSYMNKMATKMVNKLVEHTEVEFQAKGAFRVGFYQKGKKQSAFIQLDEYGGEAVIASIQISQIQELRDLVETAIQTLQTLGVN